MEQLIPLMNELQDVFTAVGASPLSLPQLCVVGSQSAGKSSVIEAIVGRDFLPRGTGIVTRRPLILQLITTRDEQTTHSEFTASHITQRRKPTVKAVSEWGEFLHLPNQRFTDFNAIRLEIIAETDRVTSNKSISPLPITLKLYSPNVLPLTLIDLPGLTKVAVGDQPANIGEQIDELIMSYIQSPMTLILAITSSNTDIATSDAIQLAKRVDPYGQRTIGVLTKIDLMDAATDCLQTLNNQLVHLNYGFVGLVCRSQADINAGKSVAEGLKNEERFFNSHPVYRPIAMRLGTRYLRKRLNAVLMEHIKESLPEMRSKIQMTLTETRSELADYTAGSNESVTSLLLPTISKFCTHFNDALDGRAVEVSLSELYGGARISYVFRELFSVSLDMIDVFDILTEADIRTAIRNASGPRPSLFIPEVSFELLVKKQIERLSVPSLDCVDLVLAELQRVAQQCEQLTTQLIRFPVLREHLMECVNTLLKSRLEPTKAVIHNLLHCELSYINTSHPDFIGGSRAVAEIMEQINQHNLQENNTAINTKSQPNNPHPDTHRSTQQRTQQQQQRSHHIVSPASQNHNNNNRPASAAAALAAPHQQPVASESRQSNGLLNLLFRSPSKTTSEAPLPSPVSLPPSVAATSGSPTRSIRLSHHQLSQVQLTTTASNLVTQHMLQNSLIKLAPTEREQIETKVIQTLICSYFNIVRKNIADMVPKAIMGFLVNYCKKNLQSVLVEQLYKTPAFVQQLMTESEEMENKRAECQELCDILHRALQIIEKAQDWTND